jgi:hypothetical protein
MKYWAPYIYSWTASTTILLDFLVSASRNPVDCVCLVIQIAESKFYFYFCTYNTAVRVFLFFAHSWLFDSLRNVPSYIQEDPVVMPS